MRHSRKATTMESVQSSPASGDHPGRRAAMARAWRTTGRSAAATPRAGPTGGSSSASTPGTARSSTSSPRPCWRTLPRPLYTVVDEARPRPDAPVGARPASRPAAASGSTVVPTDSAATGLGCAPPAGRDDLPVGAAEEGPLREVDPRSAPRSRPPSAGQSMPAEVLARPAGTPAGSVEVRGGGQARPSTWDWSAW